MLVISCVVVSNVSRLMLLKVLNIGKTWDEPRETIRGVKPSKISIISFSRDFDSSLIE
ncbi:MAG: hypothetical protein QFX33_04085 [Candidatus Nezhaarchaeota archaeon]|nr:hypothetical protein [Candidatus Nezhaarchaeota archaeon]